MWWNLLCDLFVLGYAWKNGSLWLVGNMCSNWQLLKQAFVGSSCLGFFILCSLWHVAFAVVDLMWCPCVCSQVDCHKQLCRGGAFPTRSSSLYLIPFLFPLPFFSLLFFLSFSLSAFSSLPILQEEWTCKQASLLALDQVQRGPVGDFQSTVYTLASLANKIWCKVTGPALA